ncbi:MAG: hypothetical protein KDA37_02610 [Planctomycetales bacterium]|nr:hypothetical protein [Planctomycetales bacterium]
MRRKLISRTLLALCLVMFARSGQSCTMSVPPPEPESEWEIEVQYEDYSSVDDIAYYKVEIEAGAVPPTSSTTCQCGLGLGTPGSSFPQSFNVYAAAVAFRAADSEDDFDLEAFAGFSDDPVVGGQVATLTNGAAGFGFSALVDPFIPPSLGPEDRIVLSFLIGFDPDEFNEVNGSTMKFAAGSTEPGHALTAFSGYSTTLNLSAITIRGDFNNDGSVDAADYTIWRDTLGSTTDLRADVDESGEVDLSDYEEWERNYGVNVFNGVVASTQAPEPSAATLILAVGCWFARRR